MTHFVIYQLAPDHQTYGPEAGKFIVVSEDLEREFSGPMSEEDARGFASALNACQTVSDRWEIGSLAGVGELTEAARLCSAVIADAAGRAA